MLLKVIQKNSISSFMKCASTRLSASYSTNNQSYESTRFSSMVGKHFLTLQHHTPEQIEQLLWTALDMKHVVKTLNKPGKLRRVLKGDSVTGIFQKRSTRTRLSFEAGAHLLGAHLIFCNNEDIHLGVNEDIKDTANVISSLTDAITGRVYEHSLLDQLAAESKVPIINALSDMHHPTQALADLMTIYEHFGRIGGLKMAWVGDGNNVLNSLLIAGSKLKMDLAVATPKGYETCSKILGYISDIARKNGTRVECTNVPEEAVKGAHIIVTDTWISMGQEEEKEKRLKAFKGYQVSMNMAKNADKNWIFLHCLPRKKEEVDDEVFYSKRSLVINEAENRKWTIMAVMANCMKGYTPIKFWRKPDFGSK